MEEYFNKVLAINLKSASRETRQSTVRINVAFRSSSSPSTKELVVRITDEEDLFFLYNLILGESDFHSLKSQQGLLVEFCAFPQKFVDLLELCFNEEQRENPKFLLQFVVGSSLEQGVATLHVVETNPFKHLTHLSLKFLPGSDAEVKKYLANCLKKLQDENQLLERRLASTEDDLRQKLSGCQEVLAIKTRELNSLQSDCSAKSNQLENKHAQELTAEKEKALQLATASQQRFETEKREMERNHQSQVMKLEERIKVAENTNRDLTQKKYQADSCITDLRSKLAVLEEDCKYAKQELHKLRRENGSLDSERHEHSKTLNQLHTRVAVMEQELRDKEQVIARTNELIENTNEQRKKLDKLLEEREDQICKLEATIKSVSAEVIKGNEIIQRLQSELRNYKSKLKLKNVVTTKQEKLLSEKETAVEKCQQENTTLQNSLRNKEEEVKKLSESLETATAKLEESKQLLKTNENVINWLNKQMNDQMMSQQHLGPFEMHTSTKFARGPPLASYSKVPDTNIASCSAESRTDMPRITEPAKVVYRKPGPRPAMLPHPIGQSTPNLPSGALSTGGVTPLSRPLTLGTGSSDVANSKEPILDAKYFHPTGGGANSQKPRPEPPLMSAYFPKP